jgi:GxxExxY protein
MSQLLFPELSYKIVGILFSTHNELGKYAREKQYADKIEDILRSEKMAYRREVRISSSGNVANFIINENILIELKVVPRLTTDHFRQIQNYLQQTQLDLGLLVNFRNQYLRPIRILRIRK